MKTGKFGQKRTREGRKRREKLDPGRKTGVGMMKESIIEHN